MSKEPLNHNTRKKQATEDKGFYDTGKELNQRYNTVKHFSLFCVPLYIHSLL